MQPTSLPSDDASRIDLEILTDATIAVAQEVRSLWSDHGHATGPADREASGVAVCQAYEAAGLEPPRELVWLRSPLEGLHAAHAVSARTPSVRRLVWSIPHARAFRLIRRRVAPAVVDRFQVLLGLSTFETLRTLIQAELRSTGAGAVPYAILAELQAQAPALLSDAVPATGTFGQTTWKRTPSVRIFGPRISLAGGEPMAEREDEPDSGDLCGYGQHEAGACALYDLMGRIGLDLGSVDHLLTLGRTCGWWWPYRDVCILTERPAEVVRDRAGRVHSDSSQAITYSDGWGVYAYGGIRVPFDLLFAVHRLEPIQILTQPNLELRRVMIEKYGLARLFERTRAREIDRVGHTVLLQLDVANDEPITAVKVVCPSTKHVYVLRVPPWITSCRDAVAWTFGIDPMGWNPLKET